jgi:hypothetical protein
MNQKKIILDYLEEAYSGAKMMDDVEMMQRLNRAIIAFSCDKFDEVPDWEEMMEEYMSKEFAL